MPDISERMSSVQIINIRYVIRDKFVNPTFSYVVFLFRDGSTLDVRVHFYLFLLFLCILHHTTYDHSRFSLFSSLTFGLLSLKSIVLVFSREIFLSQSHLRTSSIPGVGTYYQLLLIRSFFLLVYTFETQSPQGLKIPGY